MSDQVWGLLTDGDDVVASAVACRHLASAPAPDLHVLE